MSPASLLSLALVAVAAAKPAAPAKPMTAAPAAAAPAAASPAPAAAKPATPTKLGLVSAYRNVALMPLTSLGSTDELSKAIERVLTAEIGQLLGDRLIGPDKILERGELASKAFLECEGVVVCLMEVIGGLGWDAFIVGNVAGLGQDRVINLKLVDVRTGGEVRRASEAASGDETTLITNMRRAAVTLLSPELLVGAVDLACPEAGVQILVDGRAAGVTPLQNGRVEVPVGKHAIEANREGKVPFSTVIDVAYGEVVKVSIMLPDNTAFVGGSTPFRSRWWTWTLAGAGVITAGAGGFFNFLQADTVAKINARARDGTLTIQNRYLYAEEETQWIAAVSCYAVGAAIVATVGVLLGLDFIPQDGPAAPEPSAPATASAPPAPDSP